MEEAPVSRTHSSGDEGDAIGGNDNVEAEAGSIVDAQLCSGVLLQRPRDIPRIFRLLDSNSDGQLSFGEKIATSCVCWGWWWRR